MKLNVISDLHLSMQGMEPPETDADVVVLAGDVARPEQAIAWARSLGKPVIFVPGNHEFYGGSLKANWNEIVRLSEGSLVSPLQLQELMIDGVRFLGATLWTSFRLFPDETSNVEARAQGAKLMRDFSRIRMGEDPASALFSPAACARLHDEHVTWLARKLQEPHEGPTVVVTHHAPSPRSISPQFAGSLLNACFVSDCEHLMNGEKAALWVHGHTHDSFDYSVKGTRVLCNSRGYFRGGASENPKFKPTLVVQI